MKNRYTDKHLKPTNRWIDKMLQANFPFARDTETDNFRGKPRPNIQILIRWSANCTALYRSTRRAIPA